MELQKEPQKTTFETETAIQEFWQHHKTYAFKHDGSHRPMFSIDTPPPTVSGSLHIGHVFSYTQTDIVARYKRMCGHDVFYPMGFDDNGLPTERFVEKTHSVSPFQIGRSAFIELCLKQTAETEKAFENLFKRLGLSVDWNYHYSTINERSRRISQKSFIELYKKGHIYRKEEPALYCTACRTTVAQAELDDVEKTTIFYDIAFKTMDGKDLIIATTRPELLPSCVAMFYHPDDARYQHLKGQKARVPLFEMEVPILADEKVNPEKGTGLVMCCTFGDKTDIEWFKKHNLPYRQSIGRDGRMTEIAGVAAGKKVAEARKLIVEALANAGCVKNQKSITHAVNIHERCKNDIEYLTLSQWFLKLLENKQTFIKLADQINWYPAFMKSRYVNWVENIGWDWCLSRQRFYGIPFPAWHCVACKQVVLAPESMLPVDPQETPAPVEHCPQCKGTEFVPDTDIMDTWNTSSLTPYICKDLMGGGADFIPMSMRPQSHDIIRTWTFDTIVKSWLHEEKIPWNNVVISGHVLSSQGDKISKSQANSPLIPDNLLKMYPADVIRYWTASATLGYDVAFSETPLKIGKKLHTKLVNAYKFLGEHGTYSESFVAKDCHFLINQWLCHQTSDAVKRYHSNFAQFEFGPALEVVERLFWNDFCDNYLEIIKDQFFNPQSYEAAFVQETKMTLAYVGRVILQMYAPFMPFITETIYQTTYKPATEGQSLHTTNFNDVCQSYEQPAVFADMTVLLILVNGIRKLKSDNHLSLRTELQKLVVVMKQQDVATVALVQSQETLLKGIARAAEIVCEVGDSAARLDGAEGSYVAYVVVEKL